MIIMTPPLFFLIKNPASTAKLKAGLKRLLFFKISLSWPLINIIYPKNPKMSKFVCGILILMFLGFPIPAFSQNSIAPPFCFEEEDGDPSTCFPSPIKLPNDSITVNADGSISVTVEADATAAGDDTQVQFNDEGVLGSEATFTYNKTLNSLAIDRIVIGPGIADYLMPTARGTANTYLRDNGAGAITWAALSGIGPANFTPSTDFGDVNTDAGGALRYGGDSVDDTHVNWGSMTYLGEEGISLVTAYTAVGTFESGDTFICYEDGVGARECDFGDLPGGQWTDTGSILHPSESTVDEIVVGGTTEAGADIFLGVDGVAVFNEQAGDSDFRIESVNSTDMFFLDASLDAICINCSDPDDTFTVQDGMNLRHTAAINDDHAFEIEVDAAGYGDVKAIDIVYVTGAIETGEDEGVILLNVDQIAAAGGEIFGLEMLATEGSADALWGLKVGAGIGPIHQDVGTFANPTKGTDNTIGSSVTDTSIGFTQTPDTITDSNNGFGGFVTGEIVVVTGATTGANNTTYTISAAAAGALTVTPQPNTVEDDGATITVEGNVPNMIDNNVATTTAIFEADNEYILIGAAAAFGEIELIFDTVSSKNAQLTFGYSISGSHQFTAFSPVDGTNGCRNNGIIAWDAGDLVSHIANDDTSTFDIKITTTRNGTFVRPILGYARTAAITEYTWDNAAKISAANMNLSGLTASEIVLTDASKNLVSAAVATYPSLAELAYVKGLTSAIQTQLGTKAPTTAPTFATSITGSYLTASEIVLTDASKNLVSAAVATYPSLAELAYVKGVTSAIQTQLGTKDAVTTAGRSLTRSTNDFLADAELYTLTKCIIIETPTTDDDFMLYHVELGSQMTAGHCIVEDATSATIQFKQCDVAGDNCSNMTSAIVCDVGGQADDGTIDAPDMDVDDWIRADVTAINGTPGVVTACITFTMDD